MRKHIKPLLEQGRLAMTLPDRCEGVGEYPASFFNADKYYRCYNKKDWRINHADYTIGRYSNIHR